MDKGQKNQMAYADETERIISFTAEEAWSTRVNYPGTKAAAEEWVSLNPSSGEAGTVTISVALDKNFTGKSRRAEITIICGDTQITVIIEQKGETEEGKVPDESDEPGIVPEPEARRITKIKVYDEESLFYMDFEYDKAGRIVKCISWNRESTSYPKDSETFWVYERDRVVANSTSWSGPESSASSTCTALLQDGRIVESEEVWSDGELYSCKVKYEYNAEGKLVKKNENDQTFYTFVWKDGVIISSTFEDQGDLLKTYTYEYYDLETIAPKPLVFDFVTFATLDATGDAFDMFTGYIDVFPNRYLKKTVSTDDEWDKDNGTEEYRYETDGQGYVTKVFRIWTPAGGSVRDEELWLEFTYGK